MKNRTLNFGLILIMILSLNTFFLLSNGNYSWLIITISIVASIFAFYFDFKKNQQVITVGNIFTVYWFFYTNSFWLNYNLGYNQNINLSNIYLLSIVSILGFVFFHFAYSFKKNPKYHMENLSRDINEHSFKILEKILIIILILGLLLEIIFFLNNGVNAYFLTTRSTRSLIMNETGLSNFFTDLLFLVYLLSLCSLIVYKSKLMKTLFAVSMGNLIVYQLLIIDRSGFLQILFPLFFLLLLTKKVKNKTMIILGLTLFVFLSYFKTIMSSLIFNTDIPLEKFKFNSEFEVWYGIGSNIIDGLKNSSISYLYGESYLSALYNLIMPFNSTEPLSIWYVKSFYPEIYIRGGGLAFSSVAEAILNLGVVFVPIHFLMLGLFCRFIDSQKFNNIYYLSIYTFLLTVLYKFFRSEVYSLVKASWWFYILPVILIFLIINLLDKNQYKREVKVKSRVKTLDDIKQ